MILHTQIGYICVIEYPFGNHQRNHEILFICAVNLPPLCIMSQVSLLISATVWATYNNDPSQAIYLCLNKYQLDQYDSGNPFVIHINQTPSNIGLMSLSEGMRPFPCGTVVITPTHNTTFNIEYIHPDVSNTNDSDMPKFKRFYVSSNTV